MKKGLRDFLCFVGGAYLLNASLLPLACIPAYKKGDVNDQRIQELMQTDKYFYHYSGTNEEMAEKYLKLAHAITMKNTRLSNYGFGTTQEDKLEGGYGNCSETSPWTYSNYLYLTEKAGKKDLWEYVKESSGTVYSKSAKDGGGHAWLEIKKEGNWIEYETTANDLDYNAPLHPALIDYVIQDHRVYDEDLEYHETSSYQVEEDRSIDVDLDFYNIVTDYKGFAYMFYKAMKD